MRLSKKLVIAALGSATLVLNPLAALAAGPTIEDTDGPLVRIAISDTLNCSINYKGDSYIVITSSITLDPRRVQPTVERSSLWDLSSSVRGS